MGFNPFSGRSLIGLATLGGSEALGENTMSKIPVLNSLGGYESDSQKALQKKQQQMAEEAKKKQQENARARMQALGQSMLAFNPQNQMMAQMFGPQAAFSPDQFAQMAAAPNGGYQGTWGQGSEADQIQQVKDKEAEQKRQQMIRQQMQPVGPGPAPLAPRAAPQGARRF